MANKATIVAAIQYAVKKYSPSEYSQWTIGITSDLEQRKKEHGNPKDWHSWEADSLAIAREVETYFLNEFPSQKSERMDGGTGGNISPWKTVFVYIF